MPKFIVKKSLIHKGKIYEPGEEVDLNDRKSAADLFNRGYIDASQEEPQRPPPPPGAPASGPAEKPTPPGPPNPSRPPTNRQAA